MNDDIIIPAIAVLVQQLYVVSDAGTERPILRPNVQTYLKSDSLIRQMVAQIDEEDWQEIEVIGWLYQFYIAEKKDQVIGKVVRSEDIPAATQLFTPNWIVKYMVQNSLGHQWLATYPDSPLNRDSPDGFPRFPTMAAQRASERESGAKPVR